MNYTLAYQNLLRKHGLRAKPSGYSENHHIIPRCLGGEDECENLIYLRAKVHYLAHHLLAKIHGAFCYKAYFMMSNFYGRTNGRLYEAARELIAIAAVEIGRANGNTGYKNKTGVHARSLEQMQEDGRKGGKIGGKSNAENKTGACGRSPEKMSEDGKISGKAAFNKKAGIFSKPISEWGLDHKGNGKKGGKIAGKLPWWNNPKTGETKRGFQQPSVEFVKGRGSFIRRK